ncbi:MAG: hypothetical protein R6T89_00340, partial [Candidatus Syntrophosphaera sp.]
MKTRMIILVLAAVFALSPVAIQGTPSILADLADPEAFFEISSGRTTNTWDGSYNTNWHNSLNWSLNRVPLATDDVVIPDGMPNYPTVTADAECSILLTYGGTSLTITQGSLYVNSEAGLYGSLILDWTGSGDSPKLIILNHIAFNAGSSVNVTQENAGLIYLGGDVFFNAGSNLNMTGGFLQLAGIGNSHIRTYAPTTIHHLVSSKDPGYDTLFLGYNDA